MRRLLLVATLALASAQSAWAHATLVRTEPRNGAVLASAPRSVVVTFDDTVRAGPRNAAIRNSDGVNVLRARAHVSRRTSLVLPLRAQLGRGDYSVRWSIVSEDGHEEEGVIAFAVGAGRAPPLAALTARGLVTWQRVLMRTLFYLGILAAAGVALFSVAVLRPAGLEERLRRPTANLQFVAFLLAFLGSDALIHTASAGGTRFERVVQVAAAVAAIGGGAAALTPLYPRLRHAARAAAGVLFLCPTLAGHALDRGQPVVLAPLADLLHLGAAAVWLGGLAALAFVVVRAPANTRAPAARRFSALALGSVVVIALTGVARALTELSAVGQIWSTSYGRALIVKTALFVPLLALGWLNRAVLLSAVERLRRSVLIELLLLTGVVVAVGVLTDERPGSVRTAIAARAPPPIASRQPPPPPPGTFVDAQEAGRYAVGVAVGHALETVTVIGPDGAGVNGLRVLVDAFATHPCGDGCYRAEATSSPTTVVVGRHRLLFPVPLRLHEAGALLRRTTKAFTSLRTVVIDEHLASSPGNTQVSRLVDRAPNSFKYTIEGGPEGIIIGSRRWDRDLGGEWVESPQTPIRVPAPYWGPQAGNAYLVGPYELTFFDPQIPAWFRLKVDPRTWLPVRLHMVAAAHFMTDVYSGFNRPVELSPPPSR
jgi:copper transport protein